MPAELEKNPTTTAQQLKDLLTLELYLIGVVASSFLLAPLLSRGWKDGDWVRWYFFNVVAETFGIGPATVFPLGVLLGVVVLFSLDRMKWRQGLITLLGIVIGFVQLLSIGRFQGIHLNQGTMGALLVGAAVGGFFGGGRKLLDEQALEAILERRLEFQFPRAALLTWVLLSATAFVGLAEYHVNYGDPNEALGLLTGGQLGEFISSHVVVVGLPWHVVLFLAFSGTLYKFTQYENRKSVMVLGPRRGGKTTLMIGLYSTILRHKDEKLPEDQLAANKPLKDKLRQTRDAEEGFGEGDQPTDIDEIVPLVINYIHGRMFPKKTQIKSLDYGGERIDDRLVDTVQTHAEHVARWPPVVRKPLGIANRIANGIRGLAGQSDRMDFLEVDDGSPSPVTEYRFPEEKLEDLNEEEVYYHLAGALTDAERLVLVLPLDDYVDDLDRVPDMDDLERSANYVDVYNRIVQAYKNAEQEKEVIVVATMGDLAKPAFEERRGYPDDVHSSEAWTEFMNFVRNEVLEDMGLVELWNFADRSHAFPVYFEPNERKPRTSEGQINPQLDGDDDIKLNGGEELLNELGR